MRRTWQFAGLCLAAAAVAACGSMRRSKENAPAKEPAAHAAHAKSPWAGVREAIAVVTPTTGNTCRGWVRFRETPAGLHVLAEFEGLSPNAKHAFHIHEFGDASDAAKAMSTGGHYNPEGHPHAGPDTAMRHAGDLGNVQTDASGKARYERVLSDVSVSGHHNPVLGRSVIVHVKEDDLKSQPTGAAGDRIGCGVIGVAKAQPLPDLPVPAPK